MAGSVNKVSLLGYLGADPDIKTFDKGGMVANLSVATSETWKDDRGERQERTTWHRVAIFNEGLVKIADKYLHKGSRVYLEGQLETRSWQDKDGIDRYSTEVVLRPYSGELTLLDPKPEEKAEPPRPASRNSSNGQGKGYNSPRPR